MNKSENKKPNFFIVGAARCATTTLYHALKKHPNVFMSPTKEPGFFLENKDEEWDSYLRLFSEAKDEKIIGEASTGYLISKIAARGISRRIKDPKILIQLRDPVERAISEHKLLKRYQLEKLSFLEALKKEKERIKEGYPLRYYHFLASSYYKQVKRFYDHFDKSLIKITIFHEFTENPKKVLEDICNFLEIKPFLSLKRIEKYNSGNKPYSSWLNKIVTNKYKVKKYIKIIVPQGLRGRIGSIIKNLNISSEPMRVNLSEAEKERLRNQFKPDINKLEELIDRDLSFWK